MDRLDRASTPNIDTPPRGHNERVKFSAGRQESLTYIYMEDEGGGALCGRADNAYVWLQCVLYIGMYMEAEKGTEGVILCGLRTFCH